MALGRREAELMGGCGMASAMYGKVAACTLLCHDFAEYIHVLTGTQFAAAPHPHRDAAGQSTAARGGGGWTHTYMHFVDACCWRQ